MDKIRVAIRVRPLIKRERDCKQNWLVEKDSICQVDDNGKKYANATYTFDRIFGDQNSTYDLYLEFARPIVLSVMEGINGTLFAYGQTSSGKTYTMSGNENSPGIIPHALHEVFLYISKSQNREFLLRVSYMEIYNEIITDLLNPKQSNLRIRENTDKEISVEKLTEKVVTSVDDIIDIMRFGEKNRHIGCTNMNEKSSRSHTIFRMVAESRETHASNSGDIDGAVKVSHLNLVDLAGSERPSLTGAEGIRLKEGGFINKSLFALGNVINKLSEGESTFVPFRDSKLTRILQNSLGGNAKTSIICAVTTASTDETLSTLQFASRAKRIQNRPEVNEVLDDGTMLKRCRREINELKKQLEKSHTREELLKREMELQMEKDMIQKELEEQRTVAEETKAKLRELTNVFCTPKPKESEFKQRQQRRWTVCPMGAHRKASLQLDLPFDGDSSKRLEQTFAGSPSKRKLDECDTVAFNVETRKRFLEDLQEREEDGNVTAEESVLNSIEEYRRSLTSESNSQARIEELELEVKSLMEQRDALCEERDTIRNDLSENISTSIEIQEELHKTKDRLKDTDDENRSLKERLQKLECSLENENIVDSEKNNSQARIEELELNVKRLIKERDNLTGERDMIRNDLSESISTSCEIQEELHKTKDQLKEKDTENHSLKEQLQQVECERENDCINNNEKLTEIREELSETRDKLKETDEEKRSLQEQLQQFKCTRENDNIDNSEKLNEIQEELRKAMDKLEIKDEENRSLPEQLHQLESSRENDNIDDSNKLSEVQEELNKTKEKLVEKDKENRSLQEQLQRLESSYDYENDGDSEKLSKVQEELRQTKDKLIEKDEENRSLQEQLQQLESSRKNDNIDNSEKLSKVEEELRQTKDKLIEKDEEYRSLQEQLQQLESSRENDNIDNSEKLSKVEDELRQTRDILRERDEEYRSLQEQLQQLESLRENDNIDNSEKVEEELRQTRDILRKRDEEYRSLEEQLQQLESLRENDNIDSSEKLRNVDEELHKTKAKLTEKDEENRSLQEQLQQLESSRENDNIDNSNKVFQQEVLSYKTENEALRTELQDAVFAKEEAVVKCEELQKQRKELEEKIEMLNVIQDELSTVDALQEELVKEQEKNKTLRQELDLYLENSQKCSTEEENQKEKICLQLREKDEIIETKSASVAELEENVRALIESREKLLEEHETTAENLRQDFDSQIEHIRQAVEEKERELARAQDENVNTLRAELDKERERLSEVVNESASQIRELDNMILEKNAESEKAMAENQKLKEQVEGLVSEANQINKDLSEKKNRVSELESQLAKIMEHGESLSSQQDCLKMLTEERDCLQNDLSSSAEELSRIKNELLRKSDEVSLLENLLNEANSTMESLKSENNGVLEELQQQQNILKTDLENLLEEKKILKMDYTACEAQILELKEQNRMLHVAQKEMISSRTEIQQAEESRIDEINHSLLAIQEKLEQKEFVIDEKEIEIIEKAGIIEELEEKLAAAEQTAAIKERRNAELLSKLEKEIEEAENWRMKLTSTEEELLQTKEELEKTIERVTNERNALQEKVKDSVNLSEKQLRELYNTMEDKSQRIADLEQELTDVRKKDGKIFELELEIDILREESLQVTKESEKTIKEITLERNALREKVNDSVSLSEEQLRELYNSMGKKSQRIADLEQDLIDVQKKDSEISDLKVEIKILGDELLQVKKESQETIKEITNERNSLQEKVKDSVNLSEKQLRELYNSMEDKSQRIAHLEQDLIDANKKDEKISELELEIGILRDKSLQAKKDFENINKEITHERNALREKVKDSVNLSEKQLRDLYNTMEEKSQRIADMEQELTEAHKKDATICKLELEVDILRAECKDLKMHLTTPNEEVEFCPISDEHSEKLKNLEIISMYNELIQQLKNEKFRHASTERQLETCKDKVVQFNEKSKSRIAELVAQNEELAKSASSKRNEEPSDGASAVCKENRESSNEDFATKDEKIKKQDEDLNKAVRMIRTQMKENQKYKRALKECEEEISGFQNKNEKLENENEKLENESEELKKNIELKNIKIQEMEEQSRETDTLRSQISSLEGEVRHLRELSDLNLKEERTKTKDKLKTKELDLYHVDYEKTKQLDKAKRKIGELEKDVASYARKNHDLKAEIRSLKNRDEEPTINIFRGEQSSSSSTNSTNDNVGVVGSLALFSLNARVEKLTDENKQLRTKSEILQVEVDKLGIINADLKQRNSQVMQKYDRLKANFDRIHETKQKSVEAITSEQSSVGAQSHVKEQQKVLGKRNEHEGPTRRRPETATTHHVSSTKQTAEEDSKEIAGAMQSSNQASKTTIDKSTLEKTRKTYSKGNKENNNPFNSKELPDACKTQ